MERFTSLTAQAAFLPLANIDTDMLVPKQYLKTIKRAGLGRCLFAEQRYRPDGTPEPTFVLNQKPGAKILLAGENFGCGSSREHAPWALLDFGIRAVIAPGFADIFYNNSYKNGLLLIKLDGAAIAQLAQSAEALHIDLEMQSVTGGDKSFAFEVEPHIKKILLEGLDGVETLLRHRGDIEAYESAHFARQPWIGDKHA